MVKPGSDSAKADKEMPKRTIAIKVQFMDLSYREGIFSQCLSDFAIRGGLTLVENDILSHNTEAVRLRVDLVITADDLHPDLSKSDLL